MDMPQEPFCVEIYRPSFFRAYAVEMHTDISQKPFGAEIYRENAVRFSRDTRFAQAYAVEMHMDMSQKLFCMEIYRDVAGHGWYHLH